MKDDKNNVIPLFVNGELNDSTRRRKARKINEVKLPTKRFGAADLFLSFIGLLLVGYGLYSVFYKNTNENKNSNSSISNSNITSNEIKNDKIEINYTKYIELTAIEEKNVFSSDDKVIFNSDCQISNLSNNAKLALASKLANKHTVNDKSYILEEEMDKSIKNLFGNINYTKSKFVMGNELYTYNQETKRYYLMDNSEKYNLTYKRYNYSTVDKQDNKMIIKNYAGYTDNNNTFSTTLGNTRLNVVISNDNIKDNINSLKYYEYEFIKENDGYKLISILLK